ncbi:methyltransferase [Amycolatopsis deserti]|uniref:Methyltransferase n=1 Tax=Amycolatopsis deserti TaxID=185696 RepID=A0ABQ3JBE2_9PSEU|nr:class I SAM-dependent methyltransferase [Amycolatopsis deserti]GHF14968.1 methyltransferase [Amycolatopsis deserti]
MEVWAAGDAYEAYMGRWSAPVAEEFLRRLAVPSGKRWLDVGCGTGVLTGAIQKGQPRVVVGVDPSAGFLAAAKARRAGAFVQGDARALPVRDNSFDAVVSGLALNFVPDPAGAVGEFARAAAPGGTIAAYVWDYAGGMGMLRIFWDAAVELNPAAAELDEGRRFPVCHPQVLVRLWTGLDEVTVAAIDVDTPFADFDDYWAPFRGGQGPAPGYVAALDDRRRDALRDLLRERFTSTGLTARAWMVRGVKPSADR